MTCLRCSKPGSNTTGPCTCPLICVCLVARPDGSGQCVGCLRRIAHLMSPDNYRAALEAYPTIGEQAIDWTYRLALVGP